MWKDMAKKGLRMLKDSVVDSVASTARRASRNKSYTDDQRDAYAALAEHLKSDEQD